MDLNPYLATLRENLATAASAGDADTRRTAAVLSAALEPAARLAMMNALSDLAAEVTANLDDHVVDVRLEGADVRVVVTPTGAQAGQGESDHDPPPTFEGGDLSRVTVRIFEELKGKAEEAAAAQGMSLNSFVTQAVQGALHHGGPWMDPAARRAMKQQWKEQWKQGNAWQDKSGHSHRVHGWVQP